MKKAYTTPGMDIKFSVWEKSFLVVSSGNVQNSSFEGDWVVGDELDY